MFNSILMFNVATNLSWFPLDVICTNYDLTNVKPYESYASNFVHSKLKNPYTIYSKRNKQFALTIMVCIQLPLTIGKGS